jgi:hypothetical protein
MEYDAADRINSCWTAWFLKMEREGGPETSVTNYQPRPRNKLQQRRPDFKCLAQRINYERNKTYNRFSGPQYREFCNQVAE